MDSVIDANCRSDCWTMSHKEVTQTSKKKHHLPAALALGQAAQDVSACSM